MNQKRLFGVLVLSLGLFASNGVQANFIVGYDYGVAQRIDRNGTLLTSYVLGVSEYESFGSTHATTSDGSTVYFATNSLGFSDLVAFDVKSGAYRPELTLNVGFHGEGTIISARQALIRPHDPYGLGDLFILSRTSQNFDNPGTWNVKRFNRATKTYVETISPPTPQTVYDIAFHPDGALYVAGANGIFAYSESIAIPGFLNGGFSGRVGVMLPFSGNATGNLTFGPDGLLYVRNVATGDIDRYTALGQLVDTFIPFSAIADSYSPNVDIGRGSIQFGPDGDLYLMQSPGKIARFNGTTGEFVHATPSIYVNDRITVLPVPEPIAALMALVGCSFVGCVRRQGK